MNEKQTKDFVDSWNIKNNFPTGVNTQCANMRYYSPGIVTWNEYDAPEIDISQIVEIYNTIMNTSKEE